MYSKSRQREMGAQKLLIREKHLEKTVFFVSILNTEKKLLLHCMHVTKLFNKSGISPFRCSLIAYSNLFRCIMTQSQVLPWLLLLPSIQCVSHQHMHFSWPHFHEPFNIPSQELYFDRMPFKALPALSEVVFWFRVRRKCFTHHRMLRVPHWQRE